MAAGDPVRLSQNNVSGTASTQIESAGDNAFRAFCTASNARTRGVWGETASPRARSSGVFGLANSSSGSPSGVRGISTASDGVGVIGEAQVNTPTDPNQQQNCAGVKGTCTSAAGVGIQAENTGGGRALEAGSPALTELGAQLQRELLALAVESDPSEFDEGESAIQVLVKLTKSGVQGGVLHLRRVKVGGRNSGGQGFRILRVDNDPV
jgi:hypothetical protein